MKRKLHFLVHLLWGTAAVAGFGAIVMLLWNAVMPSVFIGVSAINFWQALGLLVLGRILVGSFGGFGGGRHGLGAHFRTNPIHEKWLRMSPEEREKFIHRHHFGRFGHFDSDFFNPKEEPEKKDGCDES
jgi:hypothetical protein